MLRNSIKFLSLEAWCQCACKLQNRRHVPFVETPLRLGKWFSACSLLPLCKEEIQNLSLAGMRLFCGEKPPLLLLIGVSRLHLSAAEWSLAIPSHQGLLLLGPAHPRPSPCCGRPWPAPGPRGTGCVWGLSPPRHFSSHVPVAVSGCEAVWKLLLNMPRPSLTRPRVRGWCSIL